MTSKDYITNPLRALKHAIERAQRERTTCTVWTHPDGTYTVHTDTPTWRSKARSVASVVYKGGPMDGPALSSSVEVHIHG